MCLGVPGQIIEVRGKIALTDFWGVQREVLIDNLAEPLRCGDTIIAHAGIAVRRIPPGEAAAVLAMYEVVLCEAGEDPIALDVIEELELEPA
jgi:hydrogenase expression/formation protein HypC